MKRALPLVVIAVVTLSLAVVVVHYALRTSWERVGRAEWPAGLGTLESYPRQFPKAAPTPAALRLIALGQPLNIEFTPRKKRKTDPMHEAVAAYVKTQQERNTLAVDEAPAAVVDALVRHERELDALRDHLLRHGGERSP